MKGNLANNILYLVISITIALMFLPLLQDGIDALTGVGMAYEDTTTGALINMLPVIIVAVIVFFVVKRLGRNQG